MRLGSTGSAYHAASAWPRRHRSSPVPLVLEAEQALVGAAHRGGGDGRAGVEQIVAEQGSRRDGAGPAGARATRRRPGRKRERAYVLRAGGEPRARARRYGGAEAARQRGALCAIAAFLPFLKVGPISASFWELRAAKAAPTFIALLGSLGLAVVAGLGVAKGPFTRGMW